MSCPECASPPVPLSWGTQPGFAHFPGASEVGGLQCPVLCLVGLFQACSNIAASFPGKVATTLNLCLTRPESTLLLPSPSLSSLSSLSPFPLTSSLLLRAPPYLFSPFLSLPLPLSSRALDRNLCSCALAVRSKPKQSLDLYLARCPCKSIVTYHGSGALMTLTEVAAPNTFLFGYIS